MSLNFCSASMFGDIRSISVASFVIFSRYWSSRAPYSVSLTGRASPSMLKSMRSTSSWSLCTAVA